MLVQAVLLLGVGGFLASDLGPERVRRWGHRAFVAAFALFLTAATVWLLAGMTTVVASVSPQVRAAVQARTVGVERVTVTLAWGVMDPPGVTVPAGTDVTLSVENEDDEAHALSVTTGDGEVLFEGAEVGAGAAGAPARLAYAFTAPDVGTYTIVDTSGDRLGVLVAVPPDRPGSVLAPVAGAVLVQALHPDLPPLWQTALDYLFSVINIVLAVFLLRLRPRDRTVRLLAVGMVGTAAVFNLHAHAAEAIVPAAGEFHVLFHILGGIAYLVAVATFPDGVLKPRWARLPAWRRPLRVLYVAALVFFGYASIFLFHLGPVTYLLIFGLLVPVVGLTSQAFRYRHAETPAERQQSRLLVTTLTAAFAGALTFLVLAGLLRLGGAAGGRDLNELVFSAFPALFVAIPIILVSILVRFRLWDVNAVLNRAFVYGALGSFTTLVYVAVVVVGHRLIAGGRGSSLVPSILATALVAVAFQPVRERVGDVANRLLYGRRETPYEVLAGFSGRVAESYAPDEVLPRMAQVLGDGTRAARAEVWIALGGRLVRAASWPDAGGDVPGDLPIEALSLARIEGADRTVPVVHAGETLGALVVSKADDEPLTPAEEQLLEDLAAQAGLVLRNVRLTEELRARVAQLSDQAAELRASRQRIVAAQDAERRRMERDIHDGAQQHLVALAVKLRLARSAIPDHGERLGTMIAELRTETTDALETLRNLARGIYPAVLADRGPVAALRSQAVRAPIAVEVVDHGVGRHAEDIETAVYFCCLEAIQNAAKYANADRVTVVLDERDGRVTFTVSDDGDGFDPSSSSRGRGLQNLEDRLAALNGTIEIVSAPGAGTTVTGHIPVAVLEPVG